MKNLYKKSAWRRAGCTMLALVAFLTMALVPSRCNAQSLGVKFDFKTGEAAPVFTQPVMQFESLLGFKLQTQILAFAGAQISDGRIIGGGAWVVEFPLAGGQRPMWAHTGPSLEFDPEGRPWRFGWVFGVRF